MHFVNHQLQSQRRVDRLMFIYELSEYQLQCEGGRSNHFFVIAMTVKYFLSGLDVKHNTFVVNFI